jgi:ATP-dependent DNA ligase
LFSSYGLAVPDAGGKISWISETHEHQPGQALTGNRAAIFRHACGLGLEGIVSKRIGSRYVSGRTRAWLKTKNPGYDME